MKSENDRPVSVEDLLRLKRAERPAAEFWPEFDRQLRAKQLAALVVKRPWWQEMPRLWSGLPRYGLPVGAAAILAVGFVSVRHFSSDSVVDAPAPMVADVAHEPSTSAMAVAAPRVVAAEPVSAEAVVSEVSPTLAVAQAAVQRESPSVGSEVSLASDATAPGELSQLVSLLGVAESGSSVDSTPPLTGYLTASLALTAAASGAQRGLLAGSPAFEERPTRMRAAVDPLQQMTPPGEVRRSTRLLTAMVSSASLREAPPRQSERKSRLEEERLYEQVSRFGARGAGVQVSF